MDTLRFGGRDITPSVRKLSDIRELLCDREYAMRAEDRVLYYMYRDLYITEDDLSAMKENDLRYDITIIPPLMLGIEYVKTQGHYHPLVPGTKTCYPEIYEVLEGCAHFLLQKPAGEGIEDAVLVEAEKGDKVIMPPGYGHVTINPSKEPLKMADLVSRKFSSTYEPVMKKAGAAYFETTQGLLKNENYKPLPPLRSAKAKEISSLHLEKNEEIYKIVEKRDFAALDFLNNPQNHDWLDNLY